MKAVLLLEDGTYFSGEGFGKSGETAGEIVFNTSMTGIRK
jgi:carbamoyl-phosphate synthase small subunit